MKLTTNPNYETVIERSVVEVPAMAGMVRPSSIKLIAAEFNTDLQIVEMLIEYEVWRKK